ncbi:MAG: hypothetical protein IPM18_08655 [Phycisphaerales bacterium]|nr:hypothetical protein [Phycisphaerales bacterium]
MSPLTCLLCSLAPLLGGPPDSAVAYPGRSPAQARLLAQRATDVQHLRATAARRSGLDRLNVRNGVIEARYTIRGPHGHGLATYRPTTAAHGIRLDAQEMAAIVHLQAELLATRAALNRAQERIRALEDFIAAHAGDLPTATELPPEFDAARDLLE